MSERLRQAYEKKEEKRILKAIQNLPWNKEFHAKMKRAGKLFYQRRLKGDHQ